MKNLLKMNLSIIFTCAFVCFFAYFLLIKDTFLHVSISSIIDRAQDLELKPHLLVLGLLPIYIAVVIFGAAIFGLYLGSGIRHLFFQRHHHKH